MQASGSDRGWDRDLRGLPSAISQTRAALARDLCPVLLRFGIPLPDAICMAFLNLNSKLINMLAGRGLAICPWLMCG